MQHTPINNNSRRCTTGQLQEIISLEGAEHHPVYIRLFKKEE